MTGVAGFIGSAVARSLIEEGHVVTGIDSITDYYDRDLKEKNLATLRDCTVIRGDLCELNLDPLLSESDVIFHLAGQPGVRKSWGDDFELYTRDNVLATQRLLESAARTESVQRLVYSSSSSVYGDAERFPTLETDRPQPRSPYGVTKLAAEHLCHLYAANHGVPTVSLRYFTVYGPGQRPDMAFTRFIRSALAGKPIPVFGSGEQVRDFTFIDDVVRANRVAATSEIPPGTTLNVAGGSSVSVNEVIQLLSSLLGRAVDVQRTRAVAGDVIRTGGSTELISSLTGWAPRISLEEGLKRQISWARS